MSENTLPDHLSSNSGNIDKMLYEKEAELLIAVNNFCKLGIQPIQTKYLGVFSSIRASLSAIELEQSNVTELLQAFNECLEEIKIEIKLFNQKTIPELASNFDLKNSKFLKTVTYSFEKIPYKTTAIHGGESTKIRLYLICNSFKYKLIDPEVYKCLGLLGSITHEKLSQAIGEIIAKTFHLFDLNPFNKEAVEMTRIYVKTAMNEILQLISEEEAPIKSLNQDINHKLSLACRNFTNATLDFCNVEKSIASYRNILAPEKISRSEVLWERAHTFPPAWQSNQLQSHSSQVTDLSLASFQGKINVSLNKVCKNIDQKINSKIDKQLKSISIASDNLVESIGNQTSKEVAAKLHFDESLFLNTNSLLEDFVDETNNYYEELESEVELMGPKLLAKFKTMQFGSLSPIPLDIDNIAKHILDTKLYGPLKLSIDQYVSEITNIQDDIENRINLIKYSITESIDAKQAKSLVEQVHQLLAVDKATYLNAKSKFGESIRKILKNLHEELNSNYIIHNPESWNKPFANYTRKSIAKRINTFVKSKYFGFYKSINETISDKRHESVVSNFENQHNLKTEVEYAREFVRQTDLNSGLGKKLPFYYKQLFQGKHIPVKGAYIGRKDLIDNILKRKGVDKEIAILIGGSSGSGKTHFANHLAALLSNKRVYKISACSGQATERSLNQAFAKATKIEGSNEFILKSIKKHSTFIIDDMESWWDRTLNVDPLCKILDLVKQYCKKHNFILCSNLYALEALRSQRELQQAIKLSISLAPLSKEAIREILLERHTVGGLDLELKGEYNEFGSRNFDNFISNIYSLSKGNIGLAQQIWLQQIADVNQNVISMEYVKIKNLDSIADPYWQWVLYQMLINDGLTTKIIEKLFETESDFIHSIISDLATSGLVIKKGSHDAFIKPEVQPAVEQWLTESGLLN